MAVSPTAINAFSPQQLQLAQYPFVVDEASPGGAVRVALVLTRRRLLK